MNELRTSPGAGARTIGGPLGIARSADEANQWTPPWRTALGFNAATQKWFATVNTGTVNGRAPMVQTTTNAQRVNQGSFGLNPLTGRPFFSAPVFSGGQDVSGEELINVPLYFRPSLPVAWRAIGYDGDGVEGVPAFFQHLGVQNNPALATVTATNPNIDTTALAGSFTNPPKGLRLLRKCDVWLRQPRAVISSNVTFQPGLVSTQPSIAQQSISFIAQDPTEPLKVMTGAQPSGLAIDPLSGLYTESAWDDLTIAEAYLLSPPNAELGSEPDGSWTPYVKHSLWWPLIYVPTRFSYPAELTGATLAAPVVGSGIAQFVINAEVASINDAAVAALNVITAHSLAGRWYTISGGGSTSIIPAVSAQPPDVQGFDQAAQLRAQQLAAAAAQRAMTLDPEFPYEAVAFPAELLTATN